VHSSNSANAPLAPSVQLLAVLQVGILANTMSRTPEPLEYSSDQSQCHDEHVHTVLRYIVPFQGTYTLATEVDSTQLLVGHVNKGWPDHKRDYPVPAKPFWSVRASLSTVRGLLLRGQQIIGPC